MTRSKHDRRVASELVGIARSLGKDLDALRFASPVAHVYNPLDYAFDMHRAYIERFARHRPTMLLLGMNPGPFGMVQTGIPFGEVSAVRDWLKLNEPIGKPNGEHPKRRVEGLSCTRNEVSGARLWGWARNKFGTPESFFGRAFVMNYCPLAFLEESGANRTPDKLRKDERAALESRCDDALARSLAVIEPVYAIGVGTFAEACLRRVVPSSSEVVVGRIAHPSPASPQANRGWEKLVELELLGLGVDLG
jgi:single-strand selective monofunctional uracil DNA glycosylase